MSDLSYLQSLLLVLASTVLYLTSGRGLLALYGRCTGDPIGHGAMQTAAGGTAKESTVTTTRFVFGLVVTLMWLACLVFWPAFFALQLFAWLMRRRGRVHIVRGKNWSLVIGDKANVADIRETANRRARG